mmetsp:Transcript_75836/g.165412  ORF Transcript_75836/g.165412 Transcript_75836/m.165412 type:complete len:986 (+) Transcript_75836:183-3140(+)
MFDFGNKTGTPQFASSGGPPPPKRKWSYDLLTTPVERLQKVVADIDRNCLNGSGPSEEELKDLDSICQALVADTVSVPTAAALNSFGHRLLRSVTTNANLKLDILREGRLRRSACALVALGQANMQASYYPEEEQAALAAQQTLAGRALRLGGEDTLSLECLKHACAPWEDLLRSSNRAGIRRDHRAIRLGEVAYQAYCELAALHCRRMQAAGTLTALSNAKEILEICPELRQAMWEEFLKSCLASARLYGTQKATDFLMLALVSLDHIQASNKRATHRSMLLRLLALNYLRLGNGLLAVSHAKEAVSAAPLESPCEGEGLKALLQILRQTSSESSSGAEVESVASRLMSHKSIDLPIKLSCASLLLQTGMHEEKVQDCLGHLEIDASVDFSARIEVIRFRLKLGASIVSAALSQELEGSEKFDGYFDPVLREVEGLLVEGANDEAVKALREAAAAELWKVASKAAARPNCKNAATWLVRAGDLITANRDKARCFASAGAYLRSDQPMEAIRLAQEALQLDPNSLQALLLSLDLLNIDGLEREGLMLEVGNSKQILKRLLKVRSCSIEHAAAAVQILQRSAAPDLLFDALEGLAGKLEDRTLDDASQTAESTTVLGESILAVITFLLKQCDEGKRPTEDYLRVVKLFERTSKCWGPLLVETLDASTESVCVAALSTIISSSWAHAQKLAVASSAWVSLVEFLEHFSKGLQGLEASEDPYLLTVRAWFWTLLASAKTQLAKASGTKGNHIASTSLVALDRAHHCSQRAVALRGSTVPPKTKTSPLLKAFGCHFDPAGLNNLFRVLVLLEFEARCLAGHPEVQLKQFVDEASGQEKVGHKSLLAMAKLGTDLHSRRLGIHCLQRYLRCFIGARNTSGDIDVAECALAYRELISLQASRQESLGIFEGVIQLLSGEGSDIAKSYPEDEFAWLVVAAWNNGCHFYRLRQYKMSEKWFSQSLLLAKHCPCKFDQDTMTKTYMDCLRLASE